MIEWVMAHADKMATQVVEKLWGGDVSSYKDLCYAARQNDNKSALYDGKDRM